MNESVRRDERGFTLIELLVVILILGVVGSAITGVVISATRVEQNQRMLQDVIDDGRMSMERLRQEIRAVRRVHEGEPGHMRVWVDHNQDDVVQPEEMICFATEPLPGSDGGQWQLSRWSHAEEPDDCQAGQGPPSGQSQQVMARTLVDPEPFVTYSPPAGTVADPPTREIGLHLELEVLAPRNPGSVDVVGSVRLRNVP